MVTEMGIYSLNEAYRSEKIFYMCNACGEINKPGADPFDLRCYMPEEVMTPKEQELYEKYWSEGYGCCEYVLRIDGKAAVGLCFLLCRDLCKDLVLKEATLADITDADVDGIWMPRLLFAIKNVVATVIQPMVPECDIYIGDWTDPDGHEVLVVVPYRLRDQLDDIVGKLDDFLYEAIKAKF